MLQFKHQNFIFRSLKLLSSVLFFPYFTARWLL